MRLAPSRLLIAGAPAWRSFLMASAGAALLGLTGCTMESPTAVVTPTTAGIAVTGGVHGGQQPVSGSKVYLYAASTFTNAGSATPLLKSPGYVVTDGNGNFDITADYTCPAGTYVYLLAVGGNPGLISDNPKLALGAGLGPCSSLTPTSFYSINEATTVALAYSLSNLATTETRVGAPSATVLESAFAHINNLVDPALGTVRMTTPAGGGTVPQAKIDSLADAIAACVNSDGTGSACSTLMTAADVSSGGGTPVDTFQATLNIAQNPTRNVASIYSLVSADGPFQPTLGSTPPSDWTLVIQYPSPVTVSLSQTSAVIMQAGQQEFSVMVKGGDTGSYQWTTTAAAGLLSEVGGGGRTGQTSYCSTGPVTEYVSNATPVLTATVSDMVKVQAYTGADCGASNLLGAATATIDVGKAYTTVVVFGDSFSDTGNFAHVTNADYGLVYPGPDFNYAQGRFTDDASTDPAAQLYTGLMIDQLAATLPANPAVTDSLDNGSNYAYADATTADGTSTVTDGPVSVTVENMGQQITDYLATTPVITPNTLFIVWGGTDELASSSGNTTASETAAAVREVALLQRLIDAGATDFLVPNVPPLGAFPYYNTTSYVAAETQAAATFNQSLSSGLAGLPGANPAKTLNIRPLDVFSLFTATIGPPAGAGFSNVTDSAQGEAVNPDTYLFWDDLHPTTAGGYLLTTAAASVIAPQ